MGKIKFLLILLPSTEHKKKKKEKKNTHMHGNTAALDTNWLKYIFHLLVLEYCKVLCNKMNHVPL